MVNNNLAPDPYKGLTPEQLAVFNKIKDQVNLRQQVWDGELIVGPIEKTVSTEKESFDYSIDNEGNIEALVPFDQSELGQVEGDSLTTTLNYIKLKFDGLCELVCNKVLIDDLLGKGEIGGNFLRENIKVSDLKQDSIKKSHLLNVYPVFRRMVAFLFGVYPDNIFTAKEQWKLVKKTNNTRRVNKNLFRKGLDSIETDTVLKLEIFKKTKTSFSGHSLLIKKVDDDEFIFFDPNSGEHRELTAKDLIAKVNEQLEAEDGTDIFLTRGSDYIKRLQKKKIVRIAQDTLDSTTS